LYFNKINDLQQLWSLHCTIELLQLARPLSLTPEQEEIWRHCKRWFSLDTARILSSSGIPGPVTVGLRDPILLVPDEFAADCSSQDLLAALAHECAHMKRRDFQKNLFYEVASLVVAFHPVTWMMTLKKKHLSPVSKYGVITPAILFLLSVAVVGAAMAVVIEPQSSL
jgi:hypothetical protein